LTQFLFLSQFPEVHQAALQAEALARPDPRTACFHARRALELALRWAYTHDGRLKLPYADNLSALVHESSFMTVAGRPVFNKCRVLTRLGNEAVHGSAAISADDGVAAVRELWHVCFWLAATYGREPPAAGLQFDRTLLPESSGVPKRTADELAALQDSLRERDEKLSEVLSERADLDAELVRLRTEIAAVPAANEASLPEHDYNEQQTRDTFIDLLLKEAGWTFTQPGHDTEFEVPGMPNDKGVGYVDYVLWGDDGKPLGLVEAKRTRLDARVGQRQAELYADCLEKMSGQRPVIFYSNGYEHWVWDDTEYPPRAVQGFYTKDELQLLIQRRTTRKPLATATVKDEIVNRHYQHRAIRRVSESFETDKRRKALLVMATGTGKTRTTVALVDVLMRQNWAKRILFLADRVALVNQTVNAFKQHLPSATTVNLAKEKDQEGRVYVSTYQSMTNLIDEVKEGRRRFGVGHFDLVVIDEAHRSVFNKYGAIFDYFDSHLLGLTATPKDEVSRNTYSLFDLEDGVPTDAYALEEAIKDGYLVPPKAVAIHMDIIDRGLRYDERSKEEQEYWEGLDWDEEEGVPDQISAAAINKWLFNKDTVDKVLAHVMLNGIKVEGGDRLAKTIVFAKNQDHARFIQERFDANYPHRAGKFARVVISKDQYAQTIIDAFAIADKDPAMAVSVDMLDTGIDIPEVCNLVFFKIVRSKTKFWQMIGRGTRLRENLFGPGHHKTGFLVFDYCGNLEFFSEDMPEGGAAAAPSLKERLFCTRLEMIQALDGAAGEGKDPIREEFAATLRGEVSAMNVDNFVVRPKRRLVEHYSREEPWQALSREDATELAQEVAGLPSELESDGEDAKRFDLLMLSVELAILRDEPGYERLRQKIVQVASDLEEKANIPAVAKHHALILDLQSDEWWQDATTAMLERARKDLRGLIHLIDSRRRTPLYTDFQDEIGMALHIQLPGTQQDGFERFRMKARHLLRHLEDDPVVLHIRHGGNPSPEDLRHIQELLKNASDGAPQHLASAAQAAHGMAGFVRSLVGLEREAAKERFGELLSDRTMNSHQIEFINMMIDYLCEHGSISIKVLYAAPFTDKAPHGPEGLFSEGQINAIEACVRPLEATA